ncbi:histidine phosphatase family protein [Labedella endophytica]|uniref:phosphoglycerate mutase (2,3-diphosphoglycerate-dependent) n=1 Tax=Labedella endophytica TaxID=1523160 RepID=A0A433JMR9_9MICO|nr:histidine phosphatase family protein [Labedella endophytica]RUQ96780.1 histidine phosphatase family protein [Labedella endophytica]
MSLQRLVLVRHGESLGNEAASFAESTGAHVVDIPTRDADTPLSPTGVEQGSAVGTALRGLGLDASATVWSSPYLRARHTGDLAIAAAGLGTPLVVDERLRDRELGILDRLTGAGVAALYPDEAARKAHLGKFYYRPPGGESWVDVALRLRSFLADATTSPATHGVLFVHEAIIYLIRYVLEGWDEVTVLEAALRAPVRNTSVTVLERDHAGDAPWRATLVGDVTHLEQSGVETTTHAGGDDVRAR